MQIRERIQREFVDLGINCENAIQERNDFKKDEVIKYLVF